jgi:Protein of unknown function (DUF4239)
MYSVRSLCEHRMRTDWYCRFAFLVLLQLDQVIAGSISYQMKSILQHGISNKKAYRPTDLRSEHYDTNNMISIRQGIIYLVPPITTFVFFYYFRQIAHIVHTTILWLSQVTETWLPVTTAEVDLQTQVVTQVVNGPVITSISLLFAALVSTTVSTLHSRQMEMHDSFSKQIHEAIQLQLLIQHLFPSQAWRISCQVHELVKGLFQESIASLESPGLGSLIDSLLFDVHKMMRNNRSSPIVLQVHSTLLTIAEARRSHLCIVKKHFPVMHYCTLATLALCICASFLIATDQALDVLQSIPVRLLWSILVGSFTSLAVVCYDLAAPFTGVYKVETSNVKNDSLNHLT